MRLFKSLAEAIRYCSGRSRPMIVLMENENGAQIKWKIYPSGRAAPLATLESLTGRDESVDADID